MIPAFKKGHNTNLSEERRNFNTMLAKGIEQDKLKLWINWTRFELNYNY